MSITATTVVSEVDDLELFKKSYESYAPYVDEIVIANNGMTKEQLAVVQNSKVRIISVEKIEYVELIREKIHTEAKSDFVLVLDPDETVSGGLIDELKKYGETYDYIRIPRKNIIFKKWIEHSRWWPDYQIRFFRKGYVTWEQKLHNVPLTKGTGFDLPASEENAIVHYNYESVDHFLSKMTRYARAEATEKLEKEDYSLASAIHQGLDEFISRYYYAKGYHDGMHGFVLSFLQMFYAFLVYFYWWEKRRYQDDKADLYKGPYIFFKDGFKQVLFWSQKEKTLRERIISKLLK